MKTFVIERSWRKDLEELPQLHSILKLYEEFGWGNGYVVLESTHPFFMLDYDEINSKIDFELALTFSELITSEIISSFSKYLTEEDIGKYIIGFDTAHFGCSEYNTEEKLLELTQELLRKCYE